MKKISSILVFLLMTIISYSQNYNTKVVEHTGKVQKIDHIGLAVHIELDKSFVKDAWKKELKSFGKVSSEKGTYVIESANFPAASGGTCRILSQVSSTGKGTRIWISINTGDGKVKSGSRGFGGTKSYLEDFAKNMYKADIERQIVEAQKAVEIAQKDQSKLVSNGNDLEKDLQKNADEKVLLEEEIAQNKLDKEQSVKDVAQMEKALEVVKGKLGQVR
jgi:hypothetical protein